MIPPLLRAFTGFGCILLVCGRSSGQVELSLPVLKAREGSLDERVFLRASHDFTVSAFSFGIRYDPEMLAIAEVTFEGTTLAALPERVDQAGFWSGAINEQKGEVVCGVVLDSSPPLLNLLLPGTDQTLARLTAQVKARAGERASLDLVDGLGDSFPVENVLVDEQGNSHIPALRSGAIEVYPLQITDDCGGASDRLLQFAPMPAGELSDPCRFLLRNVGAQAMGIQFLVVTGDAGDFTFVDAGGRPVERIAVTLLPGAEHLIEARFQPRTAGDKAAAIEAVTGGLSFDLAAAGLGQAAVVFIRSDANGNGRINISDPIVLLIHLFAGGKEPPCVDAADVNDDGAINVTDFVASLWFLFLEGESPRPPFPGCGQDSGLDRLRCKTPPPPTSCN